MILWSPVDYSKPNSAWREERGFVFAAQNAPSLQMTNNPDGNPKETTGMFSRLENTGSAVYVKWFFSLNNHYDQIAFVLLGPQHLSWAGNGGRGEQEGAGNEDHPL